MKSARQSQLRQKITRHIEHLQWLAQEIQGGGPFLRASFIERRRRCGKLRCRCARGRLHPESFLAWRAKGQTRRISLTGLNKEKIKELTGSYRRFRRNRSEMVRTFGGLLEAIDHLAGCRQAGLPQLQKAWVLRH